MPISNSYMYIWRIKFAVSSLKLEIVSFVLLLAQKNARISVPVNNNL